MTTLFGLKCVKYYECYTYYKCNSGKICIFDVWDMIILTQTRGWVVFCSSTHGKCHEISRFCPILLAFFSATQCRGRIECAYSRFAIRLIYRQARFVCTIYSRDMCCLCVFFPKKQTSRNTQLHVRSQPNRRVALEKFTCEVGNFLVSTLKNRLQEKIFTKFWVKSRTKICKVFGRYFLVLEKRSLKVIFEKNLIFLCRNG